MVNISTTPLNPARCTPDRDPEQLAAQRRNENMRAGWTAIKPYASLELFTQTIVVVALPFAILAYALLPISNTHHRALVAVVIGILLATPLCSLALSGWRRRR